MVSRHRKKKGLLFVVSAPSGCGKTTICKKLTSIFPKLTNSVSVTTRPPRDNEAEKKDYYFISRREFLKRRRTGKLLEWACNFGHLYGTPRSFVEENINKGKDVLLTIDVKGARKVREKIPRSIHIFLTPPSIFDLEKRLKKRGTERPGEIKKRLNIARREMAQAKRYDYVVINDSVENAVSRLKSIVRLEKER